MRFWKLTLFVLGLAAAANAADSPFTGKWKLNVEKSKFSGGSAMKSQTVTFGDNGLVSVDGTDASDKSVSWSYTFVEGKSAAITGLGPNASVVEKRKGNTVEHVWKMGANVEKGKGVFAKDGKTLTYHIKGKNAEGKPVDSTEIYEKQ